MKWLDNHILVDPPKRPKKLTATRFASVLGLNTWNTPFGAWCAITRTYEDPFTDTIYTRAGKAIEPKQIQYMRQSYLMLNLRSPEDIYGKDFFKKTYGDFFHDVPIFGGMWDSLLVDDNGKPKAVLEFKTTKRVEDWQNDVPEYYALQAALYAYLLGVDQVYMVASFLKESDYDDPESYKPSAENTIVRPFKLSERYPEFDKLIRIATDWWNQYVVTGISPVFDEKQDADILKVLRTNNPVVDESIENLISTSEELRLRIAEIEQSSGLAALKKTKDDIEDKIKAYAKEQFRDGDTKVEIAGKHFLYTMARSETTKVDDKALKADGLFDKYSKSVVGFRMTVSAPKDNK